MVQHLISSLSSFSLFFCRIVVEVSYMLLRITNITSKVVTLKLTVSH